MIHCVSKSRHRHRKNYLERSKFLPSSFFSWFPNVLITVRFDWYEESLLVLGEILRQEFGVKSSEKDVPFFFSPFSNFKC